MSPIIHPLISTRLKKNPTFGDRITLSSSRTHSCFSFCNFLTHTELGLPYSQARHGLERPLRTRICYWPAQLTGVTIDIAVAPVAPVAAAGARIIGPSTIERASEPAHARSVCFVCIHLHLGHAHFACLHFLSCGRALAKLADSTSSPPSPETSWLWPHQ